LIKICKDGIYELYYQNKYYGCIKIEDLIPEQEGIGNFHIHITRFTHNILNRMRRDEVSLMGYIRDAGYSEIISFVNVTCVKHGDITLWTKFVKLFEFEEPKLYTRRTV
jgi:hypothetical protein